MAKTETTTDETEVVYEEEEYPLAVADDARSIHERMIAILAELPAIGKDQQNVEQRFMYRGHDDVMNALNPLLAKHGVYFVPDVVERVPSERTTARGSVMYEVNLHVRYRFYGARGDSFETSAWGEGTDMGDKSTNKAMTMALKSVLAQAFAISTAELSDADAGSPEETTRPGTPHVQQGTRARGRRGRGEFDPGRDLLEGATLESAALAERQGILAPDVDWAALLRTAAEHAIGKPRDEWSAAEREQFVRRWANLLQRIETTAPAEVYNPELGLQSGAEGDEVIVACLGWAFAGWQPDGELPRVEVTDTVGDAPGTSETAAENGGDAPSDDVPQTEEPIDDDVPSDGDSYPA